MPTTQTVTGTRYVGNYRWTICALVFCATTINYLDRQVISLLKPTLEKEFNWKESDYANIVIAFQFAYAVGMLLAGRLIDKIGTRIGYALTLFLWSIASVLHAFATGAGSFAAYRAFLGITEAGNFPAAIKTVAQWFPKRERAFAAGIFNAGTSVGPVIAPIVVPWLAIEYSWRVAFIAVAATGFIWLIFWFIYYEVPAKQKRLSPKEFDYIHSDAEATAPTEVKPKIPWGVLLGYRQTWAFITGKLLTDGIWWFLLFWLPPFLTAQYKLQGMQVSMPIALVYVMCGIASIFGGWLPMYLVKHKQWSAVKARKTSMLIYTFFPLLMIVAQQAGGYSMWYAVIIIGLTASAHQAWSANLYTTVSDMFPQSSVASVIGIGGMAGALGGMGVAAAAGRLFDYYKSLGHIETGYHFMFVYCSFGYLVAWFIIFKLLVPNLDRVKE